MLFKSNVLSSENDREQELQENKLHKWDNDLKYTIEPKEECVSIEITASYEALPKTISNLNSLKKQLGFAKENTHKFNSLTQQELLVLTAVCEGMLTREIAEELHIEASTVSTHRKNINKKLQAKSCLDLYRYAVTFNLIDF